MTKRTALDGKPYAENLRVRFDKEEVASRAAEALLRGVHFRRQPEGRVSVGAAMQRRGSLLYNDMESVKSAYLRVAGIIFMVSTVSVNCFACAIREQRTVARPDLVKAVEEGRLNKAMASWWGFDKNDSTACFQAAIDSGVPELVVDRMSDPWTVTTLKAVSNQRIIFEKGAEVRAMPGAFRDKKASLFVLSNVTNVTLSGYGAVMRMRKADYMKAPYARSEHRHILKIISSSHIRVEGLTLAESGGDGIYISSHNRMTYGDIVLRDLDCVGNFRQGLSVICVDGLLVERCRFRDTCGTLPESGIDFEPNHGYHRLRNIVVRDCVSENNRGCGYEFSLGHFGSKTDPVDIRLENCRAVGCASHAVGITMRYASKDNTDLPKGRISMKNCTFEKCGRAGLQVVRKPAGTVDVSFENCRFLDNCRKVRTQPTVGLANYDRCNPPVDGIFFKACEMRHTGEGAWITTGAWDWTCTGVKEIAGDVTIVAKDGARTSFALDDSWRKGLMRLPDSPSLARVSFDPSKAKITDASPGVSAKALFGLFRNRGRLVFYSDGTRPARFTLRRHSVIKRAHTDAPVVVATMDGRRLGTFNFGPDDLSKVEVDVPSPGFFSVAVTVGRQCFSVVDSEVPIALDVTSGAQRMFRHKGALLVSPAAGDSFDVFAGGSGVEMVGVRIKDPDGTEVFCNSAVAEPVRFRGAATKPGLWRIEFEKPARGVFDDFSVDVSGVPGFLFMVPGKYWTAVK